MKIKLLKLLAEVINEIGDLSNIESYNYNITDKGGNFKTEDEYEVNVDITAWPPSLYKQFKFPPVVELNNNPIYNIGYSIEGQGSQFMKSNYKILIKILKTVSLIVEHHINKLDSQNPIFTLFAEDKKGKGHDDTQKTLIYKEILSKNLPPNYRIGFGDYIPLNVKFIYITK
jgi:hypothetical protein